MTYLSVERVKSLKKYKMGFTLFDAHIFTQMIIFDHPNAYNSSIYRRLIKDQHQIQQISFH